MDLKNSPLFQQIKICCYVLLMSAFFHGTGQSWTQSIYVTTSGNTPGLGFFGATGTGNSGIYFDASNGDWIGSDYASLLQMNDLSVQLNNYSSNPIYFRTLSNTRMTILGNGNVGIGNSSPSYLLDVSRANHNVARFVSTGTNSGADVLIVDADNTNNRASFQVQGNGGSIESFFVGSTGNVGVGTTNPAYKLDVDGDVYVGQKLRFYRQGIGATTFSLESSQNNASINVSSVSDYLTFNVGSGAPERMRVTNSGKVGIGTASPDELLTVKGTIHTQEVRVDLSVPGPDYVFEEDYNLRSLKETEAYIKANKHLPEIPSAKEMETNGVQLGEMNMLLLKKIEELTLHVIELKKTQDEILKENAELKSQLQKHNPKH